MTPKLKFMIYPSFMCMCLPVCSGKPTGSRRKAMKTKDGNPTTSNKVSIPPLSCICSCHRKDIYIFVRDKKENHIMIMHGSSNLCGNGGR